MWSPGIQNLTMLLSAALVVLTGAIVASLAIASGNDSTNDARDTGDDSVEGCFEAGEDNVAEVTARLLKSILKGTESSLRSFTDIPERTADTTLHFLQNHHPDVTNSPGWMDTTMRRFIAANHQELAPHGLRSIAYECLPFSPNSDPYNWGGMFNFLVGNDLTGLYFDDWLHFVSSETRNETTGGLDWNPLQSYMGSADTAGYIDRGNETGCVYSPLLQKDTELKIGLCPVNLTLMKDADWLELENHVIYNAKHDDDSLLLEPDKKWWSPIRGTVQYSYIHVYAAWTHPEMLNLWPRQGNRVGYLMFSLSTEGIRNIVEKQIVPTNSLLYLIERNPWTNVVGTLIGFNAGIVRDTSDANNVKYFNVTEYPGNEEVRNHGVFVFSQSGYEWAANRSEAIGASEYTGVNGTTFWWQVSLLEKDGGLGWFIALMIPRAEIMRNIDAKTLAIKADTDLARTKADEKRRDNFVILMIVIAVTALVLLLGSFYMSKRIITPLLDLEQDMSNVAIMRLEMVDLGKPLSYLHEVRNMQSSFKQMVSNLAEYRNYLPQAALVSESGDDDDASMRDSANTTSKQPSRSSEVGSSNSHSHTMQHAKGAYYTHTGKDMKVADGRGCLVEGVKRKNVSILLFNCCNWHGMMIERDTDSCLATLSELLLLLLDAVQESNGVAELFCGDRLWANFNAVRPLSSHRVSCANAGFLARTKVSARSGLPKLSFAACSAEARVGNMGCTGMKKFTVFSTAVPWTAALERLNKEKGCAGLCDSWITKDAEVKFALRCIDMVMYPKRSLDPIRVYEVMSLQTYSEQEWMYQLRDGEVSHSQMWNKSMEAVFGHIWAEAAAFLERYAGEKDHMYLRLKHIITEENYEPVSVMRL